MNNYLVLLGALAAGYLIVNKGAASPAPVIDKSLAGPLGLGEITVMESPATVASVFELPGVTSGVVVFDNNKPPHTVILPRLKTATATKSIAGCNCMA